MKVLENVIFQRLKSETNLREDPHSMIALMTVFDDWHTEYSKLSPKSIFQTKNEIEVKNLSVFCN